MSAKDTAMKKLSHDVHPAAAVWPMLDEPDLRRLAEDIKVNGQLVPIERDPEGRILDGRNRLAACQIAGVEPVFHIYEGDPVALVLSANNERRHLTTGQRAIATALTLAALGKRQNGRWTKKAIPNDQKSDRSRGWEVAMWQAGVVLDHASDLAADVVTGGMALSAAFDQAEANRKANERIAKVGPDLATLIESGVIDLAEAERRLAEVDRQVEEAKRIEELDDDLAQRVRDGHLDVGEAEAVMDERDVRRREWADNLADAMRRIARMVGEPIPAGLAELLGESRTAYLNKLIGCSEGENLDIVLN